MASYLDGKIELINPNDFVWRSKINANFAFLTAYQTIQASYVVDSSPPENMAYDRMLFVNTTPAGAGITVTFPLASDNAGREIILIRADTGTSYTVTISSTSTIKGDSDLDVNYLGCRGVWISDGTYWIGKNRDN